MYLPFSPKFLTEASPKDPAVLKILCFVDVSDIFNFFLLRGGEGGVRGDREGGVLV